MHLTAINAGASGHVLISALAQRPCLRWVLTCLTEGMTGLAHDKH